MPYTRGAGIGKASETSPGLQIVLCNDCLVALGMQQVTVLSFAHLGLCSGSCTRRETTSDVVSTWATNITVGTYMQ